MYTFAGSILQSDQIIYNFLSRLWSNGKSTKLILRNSVQSEQNKTYCLNPGISFLKAHQCLISVPQEQLTECFYKLIPGGKAVKDGILRKSAAASREKKLTWNKFTQNH